MASNMLGESRRPPRRAQANFWGRRSHHGKLLLIAVVVITVALSIGLGVGLGVGLHDSDGTEETLKKQANLPTAPTGAGIWRPPVHASWQIVLPKSIKLAANATTTEPDVDIFELDLFLTEKATIDTLHRLGKKVICYFSAGSFEPDRPDSQLFPRKDKGSELAEWPGEKWVNTNSAKIRYIMQKRLDMAHQKGCDGVDPDNVDAFNHNNGLGLNLVDSIDFMRWLTGRAQRHKLAVGLKNSAAILPQVLPAVQFVVQEQCVQFSECSKYSPAINAGKPVFHIEYPSEVKSDTARQFCGDTGPAQGATGFSTIIKRFNVDGWVQNCSGEQFTTPTL